MSRIVGIDLGTSTSEISCIIDGKPVIIPNALGKLITPSVVYIEENGGTLVGEPAAEYLFTQPDNTFMEVKRMTGRDELLFAHGKGYSPEELQSRLLRYLVGCAEAYLGEQIDRAVITVPAYFTDAQRRATARAGELAGLKVERILNEPTAAALDYGLQNLNECKNILVYDLGGGTLDVTVLELFEGVIDVKASSGNNQLGGKDFDEILMRNIADPGKDERARMRLKNTAERCKIALSEVETYEVILPFLLKDKKGNPISIEKTVTRANFETWVKDIVESTVTPMMTALADAKLTPADLDLVLLVGGSTRIPCVKKLVADHLSVIPQTLLDPDLTVARGAAIQAGILEGSIEDTELVLTDVCPYTLGIAAMNEGFFEDRIIFDPIIRRNTTIPTEKSKIYMPYADYQTTVSIDVYQGDSIDPENNEQLGTVELTGIPPAKRGKEPLEVFFSYDMNGILQVKASVVSTGRAVSAEISTTGIAAKPILDLQKWESASGAKRQRPIIRKAEKRIEMGEDDTGEYELLIRQMKEALLLGQDEKVDQIHDSLLELMEYENER